MGIVATETPEFGTYDPKSDVTPFACLEVRMRPIVKRPSSNLLILTCECRLITPKGTSEPMAVSQLNPEVSPS